MSYILDGIFFNSTTQKCHSHSYKIHVYIYHRNSTTIYTRIKLVEELPMVMNNDKVKPISHTTLMVLRVKFNNIYKLLLKMLNELIKNSSYDVKILLVSITRAIVQITFI